MFKAIVLCFLGLIFATTTVYAQSSNVGSANQEMQAGNEASTNAQESFQKLIDQCDDIGLITLRARVRVELARTTDDAQKQAVQMVDEGFALCGQGKMEEATAKLEAAYAFARDGVTEKFGQDASLSVQKNNADERSSSAQGDQQDSIEDQDSKGMMIVGAAVLLLGLLVVWFMRRGRSKAE